MPKKGSVTSSLSGLGALAEALATLKKGRVDVGFFAGDASRSSKGGKGSKAGYYKAGTSAKDVGTLRSGKQVEQLTNPELAAKHEFGIGVPRRSMLRMPLHLKGDAVVKKAKEGATEAMKNVAKDGRATAKKVLTLMGIEAEGVVDEAFETRGFGSWKENAPETILLKGSDAPLIDSSQLRRAVDSRVVA